MYSWNEGGDLEWYLGHSHLNAVELNASYYRFPYRNQVAGWARKSTALHWSVKVHRFVTHQHRFNDVAREVWQKFLTLFQPLDPLIDWYLFQAPPSLSDTGRLLRFFEGLPRLEKCVLEIRNRDLLLDEDRCRVLQEHIPLVSVDSPDVKNKIFSGDIVYLRMHGRDGWYSHEYTRQELEETAGLIRATGATSAYVFFNNDHSMLENAQLLMELM